MKVRARYAGGTKSSRLTTASSSSTAGSSTSQGRICCSIMLKRACSMFMALVPARGALGRPAILFRGRLRLGGGTGCLSCGWAGLHAMQHQLDVVADEAVRIDLVLVLRTGADRVLVQAQHHHRQHQ